MLFLKKKWQLQLLTEIHSWKGERNREETSIEGERKIVSQLDEEGEN